MAVTVGVGAVVASTGLGLKAAHDQKKLGKKALKGADAVQAKQDYYNDLLKNLLQNPASIKDDPGYEFSFGEGVKAVERSNAARGFTGSGNAAIDLLKYGEGFSSNFLKQREDLLAGLSGAGAASSPAQYLQTGIAANNSSTDILSSTLASLGYTFGKGGFGRVAGGGASAGTPAANAFQQSIDTSNAFNNVGSGAFAGAGP